MLSSLPQLLLHSWVIVQLASMPAPDAPDGSMAPEIPVQCSTGTVLPLRWEAAQAADPMLHLTCGERVVPLQGQTRRMGFVEVMTRDHTLGWLESKYLRERYPWYRVVFRGSRAAVEALLPARTDANYYFTPPRELHMTAQILAAPDVGFTVGDSGSDLAMPLSGHNPLYLPDALQPPGARGVEGAYRLVSRWTGCVLPREYFITVTSGSREASPFRLEIALQPCPYSP